ncbi:MAG: glycosyltransferase [Bacillota bacterium]
MSINFCTILTKYRLYQAVVMCRSLSYNISSQDYKIYILCLDDTCYNILSNLNLSNVMLTHIHEIENEILHYKKIERGINEYCWTLKPVYIEYLFSRNPSVERVTYLDADICFFGDPMQIFEQVQNSSILLSKHDFPKNYGFIANQCGKYNSGVISFKRDSNSLMCISWWKEKCLEWCHDRAENGKFGDQKYLDMIPQMFSGAMDIKTPGVNIAPWNQVKYTFAIRDHHVYVNNDRLIFYHFCGFRIVNDQEIALTVGFNKEYIPEIYNPYIYVLKQAVEDIKKIEPYFNGYYLEEGRKQLAQYYKVAI